MLYELPEKVKKEVKKKYLNDNLVLFAGAGLSMPFHIGSWKELIENMVSEYTGAVKPPVRRIGNHLSGHKETTVPDR